MRTTRAVGVTTALVGLLAAAGCGGSSGGPAATSQSTAAKHTASPKPLPPKPTPTPSTSSATPTSSGTAAGAPGVPEPARQHTKAGAKAFAEYFFTRANALYLHPKKGTLRPLALTACGYCNELSTDLEKMARKNERYDRNQTVFETTGIRYEPSFAHIFITLHQQPARLLDANGNVLETTPTPTAKVVVIAEWLKGKGWRVEAVQHE